MSGSGSIGSSFRDPHGFVFRVDDVIYRHVSERHREDHERLLSSGLYADLVAEDLLISHEDASLDLARTPGAYRILRPEQIPFVSYPYEWSFSQLRHAASITLRIQELALDHGMSLRDATAFNVTFHRGRPIFIDTTSFQRLPEGQPWVAYRQFCEQFLAPLAIASVDPRLIRLMMPFPDGIPLDMATNLLPPKLRRRPSLLVHLGMHGRSQKKHERDEDSGTSSARSFSMNAFRGLLDSLRKAVDKLVPSAGPSAWSDYYDEAAHYDAEATNAKSSFVEGALDIAAPASVWDLGANTGRFARISAVREIDTIAFDLDPSVVDVVYREGQRRGERHLLPLVMDLADPSPALGWGNQERSSLEARGPADLVTALALIHHLAIGRNVPLDRFIEQLARWGRWALLEWVPKSDQKVQHLLRSREDIFDAYTEEALRDAITKRFEIVRRGMIDGTDRVLYLLKAFE